MIRAARPDDLDALIDLNAEVQRLHLAAQPARYRDPSRDELAEHVRGLIADADTVVLVSEAGGGLHGYAVVRRVDHAGNVYARPRVSAHVDQLGVRATSRRAGHGRALMAAIEDRARAWGAAAISLDVQAFNDDAAAFYRALGYTRTSSRLSKPTDPSV